MTQHFGTTQKQRELLEYLRTYSAEHSGMAPNYTQMATHIGLKSKSGINRIVNGLEERGLVKRIPGRPRSIIAVNKDDTWKSGMLRAADIVMALGQTWPTGSPQDAFAKEVTKFIRGQTEKGDAVR